MTDYVRRNGLLFCIVAGSFALIFGLPAIAQPAAQSTTQPQIKAEDIVRTFTAPTSRPTPAKNCDPNEVVNTEDGPAHRKCNTLGFNLGSAGDVINKPVASTKPKPRGAQTAAYLPPVAQRNVDLMLTFALNSADLTPQAVANLDQFAQALRDTKLANMRFQIAGYTDMSGMRAHNQVLSQRRAESAVAYLTAHGIDPSRLVAKGFGPTMMWQRDPKGQDNRCVVARLAH